MKVLRPSYEILTPISDGGIKELQHIERIARVCYKSEDKISPDGESAKRLVAHLIDRGHEAMLEHGIISVLFICDRGVSHEIVRHRMASYAQESTRYCNYGKDKFGREITFIQPSYLNFAEEPDSIPFSRYLSWSALCQMCEKTYFAMLESGSSPQEARAVLPNSLKTEIVMTANYREWRHFFKLRCDKAAHPQMRELTIPLLKELDKKLPVIFEDIEWEVENF